MQGKLPKAGWEQKLSKLQRWSGGPSRLPGSPASAGPGWPAFSPLPLPFPPLPSPPPFPPFPPSFLLFLTKVVTNVSLQRKNNNANEKEYLILVKLRSLIKLSDKKYIFNGNEKIIY